MFLSRVRIDEWKTPSSLWTADRTKGTYQDPRLIYNLSMSQFRMGDLRASTEGLLQLLKFPVVDNQTVLMLAQNYLLIGDLDKAYEFLLDFNKSDTHMEHIYFGLLGEYHQQKGDLATAEAEYKKSLVNKPYMPTYLHLARMYFKSGREEEGEKTLLDALEYDPDDQPALSLLLSHYLDAERYDQAYPIYIRLTRLYPDSPLVKHLDRVLNKSFIPS